MRSRCEVDFASVSKPPSLMLQQRLHRRLSVATASRRASICAEPASSPSPSSASLVTKKLAMDAVTYPNTAKP